MPMSFRLTGRLYAAEACVMLYRGADAEAMTTSQLFLTADGRFAWLERVIGGDGVCAAEDWDPDRARRFLLQHGEGDIVDEFPEVFRKRAEIKPARKVRASAPRERLAEPSLFPLQ